MSITLAMIMNRWPETLDSSLAALAAFVGSKVAVIDQSAGLSLTPEQARHFDAVKHVSGLTLDALRNESLALARTATGSAWVLVVDADESVDVASLAAMQEAVATASNVSAFLLPRYNYVGHGRWASTYSFRLFRLDAPIAYEYDIHESISPSLVRNGLTWEYADAPIQHLDFLGPVLGKRARYTALLVEAMKQGVDLPFLKSLYAIECIWSGEHEAALQALDEAILLARELGSNSRFNGRDDFPSMLKAQFFVRCGLLNEAKPLLQRLCNLAEARVQAECALLLSSIASAEGRHSKALALSGVSIARWPTAEAWLSRAVVLLDLGELEQARHDFAQALRLNPMADDPRIQGDLHPEGIFELQCLMNPRFRGATDFARRMSGSAAH